jgi:hypothetical protein
VLVPLLDAATLERVIFALVANRALTWRVGGPPVGSAPAVGAGRSQSRRNR